MKLKVLVIGEIYSENLGDGVIGENVKHLIKSFRKDAKVDLLDLSGRETFNLNPVIEKIPRNKIGFNIKAKQYFEKNTKSIMKPAFDRAVYLRETILYKDRLENIKKKADKDYDIAVFAGGQLFLDYFLIYMEAVIEVLEKNNVPVIFNACGFGKIANSYKVSKFKELLNKPNVKSITVRDYVDEVNKNILNGLPISASQTSDPGLWSKETYNVNKDVSSKKVGLGVIYRNDIDFMNKQKAFLLDIIKLLDKRQIEWELFTNGGLEDYSFSKTIYDALDSTNKKIADRPKTPAELVGLISTYSSIISFRLHSHIVAASLKVPSIAIFWDPKVTYFFETYHAGDRCFTVDSSPTEIVNKLESIENVPLNSSILESEKRQSRENLYKDFSEAINE